MSNSKQLTNLSEPSRHPPWFRRWMILFYAATGALALLYAIAWWWTRPQAPGDFYTHQTAADTRPGALLRIEAFQGELPVGATGWRILYATTDSTDTVRTASGLVVINSNHGPAPSPVVAWAHGTTGIVPGCAPSMQDDPFVLVPAIKQALAKGWVWVASDYTGLGTTGPHPYLVGPDQARAVLDAVRAARQIDELNVADQTVVWGHSQGGHAALWSGSVAPDYAPDIEIVGVAAVAPATDLPRLVSVIHQRFIGRLLSAYLVAAYAEIYPDVRADQMLRSIARPLASDIAGRCLDVAGLMVSAVPTFLASPSLFENVPPQGHFAERLAENIPNQPIKSPVLIVQGNRDTTVLPGVQGGFVAGRCLAGQVIDYRGFDGDDHLSIVGDESPVPELLLEWSQRRFAGEPGPTRCQIVKQ